jgi:general stress protein 26
VGSPVGNVALHEAFACPSECEQRGRCRRLLGHDRSNQGLHIGDPAKVARDKVLIRSIWDADADKWFPEGPDGPDVAVVRVKPDQAGYWDAAGGARKYAWLDLCQAEGSAPIK